MSNHDLRPVVYPHQRPECPIELGIRKNVRALLTLNLNVETKRYGRMFPLEPIAMEPHRGMFALCQMT